MIFGTFLLGLPMVMSGGIYLLNLVDYSVSGFPLLFVGFLECMALSWIYGQYPRVPVERVQGPEVQQTQGPSRFHFEFLGG